MMLSMTQRYVLCGAVLWLTLVLTIGNINVLRAGLSLLFILVPLATERYLNGKTQLGGVVGSFGVALLVAISRIDHEVGWYMLCVAMPLLVLAIMASNDVPTNEKLWGVSALLVLPIVTYAVGGIVVADDIVLLPFLFWLAGVAVNLPALITDTVPVGGDQSKKTPVSLERSTARQPTTEASGQQASMTLAPIQLASAVTQEQREEIQQHAETVRTVLQQQVEATAEQSVLIDQTLSLQKTLVDGLDSIQQRLSNTENALQQSVLQLEDGQSTAQVAMTEIQSSQQAVIEVGESITQLASDLKRAGDIVMSVSDISTQSNFLALNAQIEAARAGEHGRGFSIVADEVRDLADQSRQATQSMKTILRSIHGASARALSITETTTGSVNAGVRQAEHLKSTVASIEMTMQDTNTEVTTMAEDIARYQQQTTQMLQTFRRLNQSVMQSQASILMAQNLSENIQRLILQVQAE